MLPIERLIGENSLYVSRSELIRKAIEDTLTLLIKEAKNNAKPKSPGVPAETEEDKIRRLVRKSKKAQMERELLNT